MLTLSALAIITLGGIAGYSISGISGMCAGILLGAIIAFLIY